MPACSFWFAKRKNWSLTGRVRFVEVTRGYWRRKRFFILEVEEQFDEATSQYPRPNDAYEYKQKSEWRDIKWFDLGRPELRWLIEHTPLAGKNAGFIETRSI